MTTFKQRVFSGVQPSGNLTLGNYLGAIKNWVGLQDSHETIFCVVDLHAITVWQDPDVLRDATREVAAGMIASGIDPKKSIILIKVKCQRMQSLHGFLIVWLAWDGLIV